MSVIGSQGRGGKEKEREKKGEKNREKERSETIFSRVGDPQAQIVLSA